MDMEAIGTTDVACSHFYMEAKTVHVQRGGLISQRAGREVGGGRELDEVRKYRKNDPCASQYSSVYGS